MATIHRGVRRASVTGKKEPIDTMYPHHIRLRGPWEMRSLSGHGRPLRMKIPSYRRPLELADDWGPIELRRRFNWIAPIDGSEVVWLVLDRCIGRAVVTLNDDQLGEHDFPWGTFRFDVTTLLRPNNELRIELDAARPEVSPSSVYGVLGCPDGDLAGARRRSIAGILGGVHLEVESRRLSMAQPVVQTGWSSAGGALTLRASVSGLRADYRSMLRLDGAMVHQDVIGPADIDSGTITIHLPSVQAEPWWPRALGAPRLYELTLEVFDDQILLVSHTRQIGFRTIDERDHGNWMCNGVEWKPSVDEVWPEQSYVECDADDSAHGSGHIWTLADLVNVTRHVAPDRFYRFCDRTGILVLQDLPDLSQARMDTDQVAFTETIALAGKLGGFACVAGWRIVDAGQPNAAARLLSEKLKILHPRCVVRSVRGA